MNEQDRVHIREAIERRMASWPAPELGGYRGSAAAEAADTHALASLRGGLAAMTLSEADIAAIRAAIEEDAAAVRRADWDAVVRMFTADAIRFPPHQAPIRGRVAMRAWLGTFPPIQQFTISADEIVGCDDVAFVRGRYALTAAAPGSAPMTDRGNYMGLLRKQPDGSWLWTTDMISSELPATQ